MFSNGAFLKFDKMEFVDYLKNKLINANGRSSLIFKNILASFFIKGWSVLVQLMLVPTTLACLGVYENGVWLTISSVLLWIDNLDIGLGNGLRNKLAVAMAHNDYEKGRQYVSSTFAMLAIIIVPTSLLLIMLELFSDLYIVFNVDKCIVGNLDIILVVTTILVCSTFIFKFIGNFYMGLQLPAVNNLLVTSGNTIALVATYCIYLSGIHSLLLVALVNTAAPLFVYLISYPVTFRGRYSQLRPSIKSVNLSVAKELFSIGGSFFVLQISGVVLFFSSNIIISNLFSPGMVTPYQIAHRYFMVATLIFTIIGVPYWSATTDAFTRKDFCWIKRSNRTLNRLMTGLGLLLSLMILLSDWVYGIWIGDKAHVPFTMTLIAGVYQFLLIWSTRYSYVINGFGFLRLQLIMTVSAAIAYIPLAIIVGKYTDNINCLLVVMCVINMPGLIVNIIQYNKIVNGTAKGIWKK